MFIIPVNNIPVVNMVRELNVSDNSPPVNFAMPYIAEKPLVMTPSSFFFRLSSFMRAGIANV